MKGLIAVAALALLMLTSCAATWTVRGTAPTQDETSGNCVLPIFQPTLGGLVRIRLTWTGPTSGQDSVIVAPGTPFIFSRSGPAGNYNFSVVCADSSGNLSCPALLAKLVRGNFDQVRDLR
jgi:hypothetical protein